MAEALGSGRAPGGDGTRVACLASQSVMASDVVGRLIGEHTVGGAGTTGSPVRVRSLTEAKAALERGDIDILVIRSDDLGSLDGTGLAYDVVWTGAADVSYVIAAPRHMETGEVRALVMDDHTEAATRDSLRTILGGRKVTRYGCGDGDLGARRLKRQPDAYMPGTAIVCLPAAADAAGLRRLTEPFVDDGHSAVGFAAVRLSR